MSNMTEIKTSELSAAALDWAIAKIEGISIQIQKPRGHKPWLGFINDGEFECYSPSENWDLIGPMIEKYQVVIVYHNAPDRTPMASIQDHSPAFMAGSTVLIAACRAIISANFGDAVGIPMELLP